LYEPGLGAGIDPGMALTPFPSPFPLNQPRYLPFSVFVEELVDIASIAVVAVVEVIAELVELHSTFFSHITCRSLSQSRSFQRLLFTI